MRIINNTKTDAIIRLTTLQRVAVEPKPLSARNAGEHGRGGSGCRTRWVSLSFIICFVGLVFLSGCVHQNDTKKAQGYIKHSRLYYQEAVNIYKDLILRGKDLDRLYFELGKLYYTFGEFESAIEAFKKSADTQAKKFLAIAYYRSNNFTDALGIFDKEGVPDDEYLYYKGLNCEKLNLFDKAIEAYRKIKAEEFSKKALLRIESIEKVSLQHVKDLSPQADQILARAPAQENYPQAGALVLYCNEEIEITPQGTQVFFMHYIVKILNERGKERFAETHIDYDSTFDKVELEFARTIKPNGQVLNVGSRHIRDVSKYLNFPLYSNARIFIISFPEITEGAAIEYKLRIHRNQLINKNDFVLSYPVQSSEPIIAADFSIRLPKNNQLHIKIINEEYNNFTADLNPKIKEKDGYLNYSWQFRDIPQILPESNMPPFVQINPTILLSTFSSWQEIYKWWHNLSKDKIKADDAIKNKVKELAEHQGSEEAKIRAIYNFCAQKIRYVAVEYGQAGYEPHFAGDIFRNKYGDCKDQAVLLITMLKEAGFTAWPVLIGTKEYYNLVEDFPAVLFNHAIAAIALKDKIIFLDPTAETCPFGDLPEGDQNRRVLIFNPGGYKIEDTPLFAASHNRIAQHLHLKINNDQTVVAEKNNFTYGTYDQAQRYWLLYTPPELVQQALSEKIQDVSIGARLDNYAVKSLDNLDEPIVLNYSFHGPEYFTEAGPLKIMPQLASLDTSLVARDKRKYPIDLGILETRELEFEIEIPDTLAIKYIPHNVKKSNPWIEFSAEYKHNDNRINFKQKTELKRVSVSETEYSEFKKSFEELAKQLKQRIVLEKLAQ